MAVSIDWKYLAGAVNEFGNARNFEEERRLPIAAQDAIPPPNGESGQPGGGPGFKAGAVSDKARGSAVGASFKDVL